MKSFGKLGIVILAVAVFVPLGQYRPGHSLYRFHLYGNEHRRGMWQYRYTNGNASDPESDPGADLYDLFIRFDPKTTFN